MQRASLPKIIVEPFFLFIREKKKKEGKELQKIINFSLSFLIPLVLGSNYFFNLIRKGCLRRVRANIIFYKKKTLTNKILTMIYSFIILSYSERSQIRYMALIKKQIYDCVP